MEIKRLSKIVIALAAVLLLAFMSGCSAGDAAKNIYNAKDFIEFLEKAEKDPNLDAVLQTNIDLSEYFSAENPHSAKLVYNGSFNGGNYTISGIYSDSGLFLEIGSEGTVENLVLQGAVKGDEVWGVAKTNNGTVRNVAVNLTAYVGTKGACVTLVNNGLIEKTTVMGTVYSRTEAELIGGIAAENNGTIEKSCSKAKILGSFDKSQLAKASNVGGIAGKNFGSITNSLNEGAICGGFNVGGVASTNGGVIESCRNTGAVCGTQEKTGGIAGENTPEGKLLKCDNTGEITGMGDSTGGVVGYACGEIVKSSNRGIVKAINSTGGIAGTAENAKIAESTNSATVEGANQVGGIAGCVVSSEIEACSNKADITGTKKSIGGIAGKVKAGTSNIDSCMNSGLIKATSPNANFLAGICAEIETAETTVYNCVNTGKVEGSTTVASLVGGMEGNIKDCVSICSYVEAVISSTGCENTVHYERHEKKEALESIAKTGSELWEIKNAELIPAKAVDLFDCYANEVFTGAEIEVELSGEENQTVQIAVLKESCGESTPFDIYPVYLETEDNIIPKANLMLPSTADLSEVEYAKLNKNGELIETATANLSGGKTVTEVINGVEVEICAYQSIVPAVYISLDENCASFKEVNTSEDGSTKGFGEMVVESTKELANQNGWEAVFVSEGNDINEVGSLYIKGREDLEWTTDPADKKSYEITLEKESDILSMGVSKTWVLLEDSETLIGEKFALDLAEDFGIAKLKGEFVELFVDGEYIGNMLLAPNVSIGENSVDITNLDFAYAQNGNSAEGLDLTGGYLLEIDGKEGDNLKIITNGNIISVKGPVAFDKDVADDNEYKYIKDLVTDLFDAIYTDGIMPDGKSYLDYIDAESFARYYWHQEFLGNALCGVEDTYIYKDSNSVDGKFYAGPVFGNTKIKNTAEYGWLIKNAERSDFFHLNAATLYNALLQRKDFAEYVVQYYENSDIEEKMQNSVEYFDEYLLYIEESAAMDYKKWGTEDYNDFTSYHSRLTQKFGNRAKWIAENYRTLLDEATVE